jgi:hypothetical protein
MHGLGYSKEASRLAIANASRLVCHISPQTAIQFCRSFLPFIVDALFTSEADR